MRYYNVGIDCVMSEHILYSQSMFNCTSEVVISHEVIAWLCSKQLQCRSCCLNTKTSVDNYRPVTLSPTKAKIFESVLLIK